MAVHPIFVQRTYDTQVASFPEDTRMRHMSLASICHQFSFLDTNFSSEILRFLVKRTYHMICTRHMSLASILPSIFLDTIYPSEILCIPGTLQQYSRKGGVTTFQSPRLSSATPTATPRRHIKSQDTSSGLLSCRIQQLRCRDTLHQSHCAVTFLSSTVAHLRDPHSHLVPYVKMTYRTCIDGYFHHHNKLLGHYTLIVSCGHVPFVADCRTPACDQHNYLVPYVKMTYHTSMVLSPS